MEWNLDLQNGGLVVKCNFNKNVGIGTGDPTSKLYVKQTNSATDCIITIEADKGGNNIPLTGIEFKQMMEIHPIIQVLIQVVRF